MHGVVAVALWLLSSDLVLGSGVLLDIILQKKLQFFFPVCHCIHCICLSSMLGFFRV